MAEGKWKAAWENCKDEFKSLTGEKKPDTGKLLKIINVHKTGVASALKKADEVHADVLKVGTKDIKKAGKLAGEFTKAVDKAKAAIADYSKVLGGEIDKDKDKVTRSLRHKSLKLMAKELQVIEAEMDHERERFWEIYRFESNLAHGVDFDATDRRIARNETLKKQLVADCAKGRAFIAKYSAALQKAPGNLLGSIKLYEREVGKVTGPIRETMGKALQNGSKFSNTLQQASQDLAEREVAFDLPKDIDLRGFASEMKLMNTHFKAIEAWAKTLT